MSYRFLRLFLACATVLAAAGCTDDPVERVPSSSLALCATVSCSELPSPTNDVASENPCAPSDETEGVACAMVDGSCGWQPYFCDDTAICGGIAGIACAAGEYCAFDGFTCGAGDQSGVCRPKPEICSQIFAPVCGCDGQTYPSDCAAAAAGMSIVHRGECGITCGGLGGATCGAGEYCQYTLEAYCGFADATGTCAPIPEACTLEYAPVCGCDGNTYGNACEAAGAGTSVQYEGACATPA